MLKLAPDLNIYLTDINNKFAHDEGNTSKATVIITTTVMGHQMVVIMVHIINNMVDIVLLDGRSGVNVIINGLRWKLGLLPP